MEMRRIGEQDGIFWVCEKTTTVTVLPGESQRSLLAALCSGSSSALLSSAQCLGMAIWAPGPQGSRAPESFKNDLSPQVGTQTE